MRDQRLIGESFACATAPPASARTRCSRSTNESRFQRCDIFGKVGEGGVHAPNRSTKSTICGADISPMIQNVAGLPGRVEAYASSGIAPVDRVEKITELRRRDRNGTIRRVWPNELAMFETFGVK